MSLADKLLRIPATMSTAKNSTKSTSSSITDVRALRHHVDRSKPKATIDAAKAPITRHRLGSWHHTKLVSLEIAKKMMI